MKMKKGELAKVYLPYFLAFGETGAPPKVPPYANLIMEIELLDIRKPD
jgi:FKBP-type peptidyl-prolyl cis-trans isomerase